MPEDLKFNEVAVDNEPQPVEKPERSGCEYAFLFVLSVLAAAKITRLLAEHFGIVIPRISYWHFFGVLTAIILVEWLVFRKLFGWNCEKHIPLEVVNWMLLYLSLLLVSDPF